ncbi:hypothetical protein CH293_17885 [Rhodococcus sp. 14-2470-1b]|nr:hypothetical protein CH299_18545 [Rhodococcus sp. 14-2686-1-2]OZF48942.1 hypothetical protein CH293_17885 [Rhodococcus sp. 14-2470-1b]
MRIGDCGVEDKRTQDPLLSGLSESAMRPRASVVRATRQLVIEAFRNLNMSPDRLQHNRSRYQGPYLGIGYIQV